MCLPESCLQQRFRLLCVPLCACRSKTQPSACKTSKSGIQEHIKAQAFAQLHNSYVASELPELLTLVITDFEQNRQAATPETIQEDRATHVDCTRCFSANCDLENILGAGHDQLIKVSVATL